MNRNSLPFILFAAGVGLVIFAICWSLYAYGEVGQIVGSKGLRPANSFHCLLSWGGEGHDCLFAHCVLARSRAHSRQFLAEYPEAGAG
jgi:hypothetical protein